MEGYEFGHTYVWQGPASDPPGPNPNPMSRTSYQRLPKTSILTQNTNIQPKGLEGPFGPFGPSGPEPEPCVQPATKPYP